MRLWVAESAGVRGPFSKAGGDHVGNDTADIDLLRRVIVGAGMIAGHGHRPGLVTGMKAGQEARRIVDILTWVEHVLDAAKMRCVVVVVDLHAAQIDQGLALAPGIGEGGKGLGPASGKDCFSLYIQSVGLKAALVAGLRQANGIKDAGGNAIAVGGAQDFRLARVGRGCGSCYRAR